MRTTRLRERKAAAVCATSRTHESGIEARILNTRAKVKEGAEAPSFCSEFGRSAATTPSGSDQAQECSACQGERTRLRDWHLRKGHVGVRLEENILAAAACGRRAIHGTDDAGNGAIGRGICHALR